MKLVIILTITCFMQVSANSFAQRVTLVEKQASLKNLLDKISSQTGYDFLINAKLIKTARPIDVNLKNGTIEEALEICFKGQDLTYTVKNKTVSVTPRKPSFLEKITATFTSIDVRGRVVDADGNPLPGATITIKGRNKGTKTDADGYFMIENVDERATLVITYTGYKVKEVLASEDLGAVQMDISVGDLEEVGVTVNTGYQRILPQQVTGAISQIATKAYESRVSTDFLSGLQNRLPGLLINNDIQFQGNNLFQIRGISTMTGNPKPLIVLDGYPTDLSLNDINPNEIETVTILKDAAAAAIYGVRASNGVIIIDRKKGVAGDVQLAFRSTVSVRAHDDFSRFRYDKDGTIGLNYFRNSWQDGMDPDFSYYRDSELTGEQPYLTGTAPDAAVNLLIDRSFGTITQQQLEQGFAELAAYNNARDFEKLFLRKAVTQQYNLNLSGGTNKALYYITGNYLGNKLNQQNNDNRKIQLSGRSNLLLSKKLSLELLTDYNETIANAAPIPDINRSYASERFVDANGNPLPVVVGSLRAGSRFTSATVPMGFLDQRMYPLTEMNEVRTRQRIADYRVSANLKYNIVRGLDFSLGGIYESSATEQRRNATENSSLVKSLINRFLTPSSGTSLPVYNLPRGGYLQEEESLLRSYTTRAQLNYNTQIASAHSINAIIGAELRKGVTEGNRSATFGYNDHTLIQQPVDYNELFNSSNSFNYSHFYNGIFSPLGYADLFNQSYNDDRFVSGYVNAVYSYKNRYSLTGSIRIDQSNLFGTDPKYRYKPLWSLGAAWNIDREQFMQHVTWIDALKLRVARGFNGNISKESLPQVVAQYNLNDVILPSYSSLILSSPANSGLRWEQTDNFNVGLDYTIFRGVSGSMDYYNKRSTDVLGSMDIDPFKGVSPALVNQASIRNKGLEFTLNADWMRRRKLNWNSGLVLSYNSSKVLEAYVLKPVIPEFSWEVALPTASSQAILTAAAQGYMKGEPVGNVYSYRYAGIDPAGNALYYDSKGNKTIINSSIDEGFGSLDSRGTSIPTTNIGLSNRVDVGNFYLYCMVNYYGGFVVRTPLPNPHAQRPIEGTGDYWKKAGDESIVSLPSANYIGSYGPSHLANSDRFVKNGAYLTLGDVTVSYNFRDLALLQKAGFNNFEVKLQASNLYTVGFNSDNYSLATGSYLKKYITPTYTLGLFTNF